MSNRIFYSTTIAHRIFNAVMSDYGPSLTLTPLRGELQEDAYLGSCTSLVFIRTLSTSQRNIRFRNPGWHIVKYRTQFQIDVSFLTDSQAQELAQKFGIANQETTTSADPSEPFFRSDAFLGLCDWVKQHPQLAQQIKTENAYLGDWINPVQLAQAYQSRDSKRTRHEIERQAKAQNALPSLRQLLGLPEA